MKVGADELAVPARRRLADLLAGLLDCELNKKQTEAIYIHLPTREETVKPRANADSRAPGSRKYAP